MKKSDLFTIILIASVSVLTAFFIGQNIFGNIHSGQANVKTIEKIEASVVSPSIEIFNKEAINPTIQVNVTGTKVDTNIAPGA
jgi:hypothetical protein